MAYVRVYNALGVTKEQQKVLIDIPIAELRALSAEERLSLVLRRQEVKASESSARWNAVSSFVVVAVPIAAFLGVSSWLTRGK
jgi:hypothetical protein